MQRLILTIVYLLFGLISFSQSYQFAWAKNFGGNSSELGIDIKTDSKGNSYTVGRDIFKGNVTIIKIDASGNIIWNKDIVLDNQPYPYKIAVDTSGNVFLTGNFSETIDFDPGNSIYNLTPAGGYDFFILKLDTKGDFLWVKKIGGNYDETVSALSIDGNQNIYLTGEFASAVDFDPGSGIYNLISFGKIDPYILKLDNSGNFIWVKQIGGEYSEMGSGITVDHIGNIYITGCFSGIGDFDPGTGVVYLTAAGKIDNYYGYYPFDIFVLKLDRKGNFVWVKKIGGKYNERWPTINVDRSGNVYTAGNFEDSVDFDPGPGIFNLFAESNYRIFISKLDSSGNFLWAEKTFGEGYYPPIATDSKGNVFISGLFEVTKDFDPGSKKFNLTSFGNQDIYFTKLDRSGNFLWAKQMGGIGDDFCASLTLDAMDNFYATGNFNERVDFYYGDSFFTMKSVRLEDIFILKMSPVKLSIKDNIEKGDWFNIYPNPSNGIFHFDLSIPQEKITIEVYNSIGTVVFKKIVVNQKNTIDLKGLPIGLYTIRVVNVSEIVISKKIIID